MRELFCELSKAIFDEVKQLGSAFEAAIIEAAKPPAPIDTPATLHFGSERAVLLVALRAGVQVLDVERAARDMQTLLRVRLACGHVGRIWIDEVNLALLCSTAEIYDYIYKEIQRVPQRRCYCVQREHQPVCTAGVCK